MPHAKAFVNSNKLLLSSNCLAHFDISRELTLACNAFNYGLGAVLYHKILDGTDRPIAYASHTLNPAECNYSQLQKEGLACVFEVKKFHDYVFGHQFQLVTDHKPLLGQIKEDRATLTRASARIERWLLFLLNYEYSLVFHNTTAHANADAFESTPTPKGIC